MVTVRIITADVLDGLRQLADESVHCVVTSPPYWGLRDYGVPGQLGLEATPVEYVERMVDVFREVRRVLRGDGTLWLNMGDCYATGAGKVGDCPGGGEQGARWRGEITRHRDEKRRNHNGLCRPAKSVGPKTQPNRMPLKGLKPKDLVGMPWRLAFALQADGWWLRSDIIWHKPNPMPESVTDRPTKAHEYVFLMAKAERYRYDAGSIKTKAAQSSLVRRRTGWNGTTQDAKGALTVGARSGSSYHKMKAGMTMVDAGLCPDDVNARSVWTITTQPYPEAHFATFPEELPERCIKAGCPEGGTVLDPFGGAGTTGLVAAKLGRNAILIELNPKYAAMARDRIAGEVPLLATVEADAASATEVEDA